MRSMKGLLKVTLFAIFGLTACNYTDGPCYWREDIEGAGSDGAGGGPVGPGWGGYGDAPPEPQDATDPPSFDCNMVGQFSTSLFKFRTTQQDDPSLPAGGWQEADPTLSFADGRQDPPASWSCTFNFGIPLRTVAHGQISASKAAQIAAEVATFGSQIAMRKKPSWVPADFCNQFITEMRALLSDQSGPYTGYGARVKL